MTAMEQRQQHHTENFGTCGSKNVFFITHFSLPRCRNSLYGVAPTLNPNMNQWVGNRA